MVDPTVARHGDARNHLAAALICVRQYEDEYLLTGHLSDLAAVSLWAEGKRALMALAQHHAELESEALDAYVEREAS